MDIPEAYMESIIMAATGGCVACTAYIVLSIFVKAVKVHREGEELLVVPEATSPLIRSFLPIARHFGLGMNAVLSGGKKNGFYFRVTDSISRKLSAAGRPQGINADEYVGFGMVCALAGGVFGLILYAFQGDQAFADIYTTSAMTSFIGALLWRNWLTKKQISRQTEIKRSLPFCLDLLTLSMEAGLDFTSALSRILRKLGETPLGREFAMMLHEIQLGKSRSQALRDFAYRVDVPDVSTVVASLIQAEELGASMGPILRIQAAQQRERRSQAAEEQAMKAPVKMLFPLVLFIFPTTLIMIFGPLVMSAFM